jgi:hypothetical protein
MFWIILFIIYGLSWLFSSVGFAINEIDFSLFPVLCTFIPIVNTILAIYLFYKYIKNTGFSFKESFKNFIEDLK